MGKTNELKIRLKERDRVYKDSPNVAATYIDLSHLVEDFLEYVDMSSKDALGFKNGGEDA